MLDNLRLNYISFHITVFFILNIYHRMNKLRKIEKYELEILIKRHIKMLIILFHIKDF